MLIETPRGEITSVDSWFQCAPPKGRDKQWVDGFSAKELAKAWCRSGAPRVPAELMALFGTNADFGRLEVISGEPEARVPFDEFPGEPRNADLVLRAEDDRGPLGISIEAKGHEDFGPYLGEAMADALEAKAQNPRSNALKRLEQLVLALMPPKKRGYPHLRTIRYQLLTGVAGALAWAEACQSARAVFIVHEFRTERTEDARQAQNALDLERFVHRLGGKQGSFPHSLLVGPFEAPGEPLFVHPPKLYIGKVLTDTRSPVV